MSNEYNDNIVIIEKPDSISYEQIQATIHSAHDSNKKKGLNYRTADLTAEELEKELGKNSVCYVAMDGDNVAGTITAQYKRKKKAGLSVNYACIGYLGVSPDYKGHHLADRLLDRCIKDIEDRGVKFMYSSTAEKNEIIYHMFTKRGFVKAKYFKTRENNFYSVIYLKTPFNSKPVNGMIGIYYNRERKKVRNRHKLDD